MPTATTAAKPPRVTKRRAETRARLMEAAFRVFAEKGYGHVTIEDVCEAAGYTRGAFYSQFESLEELFFLLYDEWAGRTAEQVRAAMEGADAVVDLPGVVERIVDTLLLERDWLLIKFDFLLYSARNPRARPPLGSPPSAAAQSDRGTTDRQRHRLPQGDRQRDRYGPRHHRGLRRGQCPVAARQRPGRGTRLAHPTDERRADSRLTVVNAPSDAYLHMVHSCI